MASVPSIHNYIDEIVSSLDEIRQKKSLLDSEISEEEQEIANLNHELESLTRQLERSNEQMHKESLRKRELEKTIHETEMTKAKISESFKTLLSVLKKESMHIE